MRTAMNLASSGSHVARFKKVGVVKVSTQNWWKHLIIQWELMAKNWYNSPITIIKTTNLDYPRFLTLWSISKEMLYTDDLLLRSCYNMHLKKANSLDTKSIDEWGISSKSPQLSSPFDLTLLFLQVKLVISCSI